MSGDNFIPTFFAKMVHTFATAENMCHSLIIVFVRPLRVFFLFHKRVGFILADFELA